MRELEELVKQLIQELELDSTPVKNEREKTVHVPLNKELTLSIKDLDPGFFFSSILGPCPTEKREDLYILLMKANYLGLGTGGSAIGLDGEEKFLTLSLALPYEMNFKLFKETVEDFANYVDYWKEELLRHQKAAQQSIYS